LEPTTASIFVALRRPANWKKVVVVVNTRSLALMNCTVYLLLSTKLRASLASRTSDVPDVTCI
jgi:hypothetical protein